MPALASLTTFVAGQVAQASQVNSNFSALRTWADNSVVLTDVAKTITASHTFSAAQTFSSTINGQTISAATNFTGSVDIAGVLEVADQIRFEQPAGVIKPGATSLTFRNHADNADNAVLTDAGVLTVRSGITVTAGGLTVTAGGITVTGNSTITGNLTVTGTFTATNAPSAIVRRTSDLNFTSLTDSTLTFAIGANDEYEAQWVLFHTNATATATGAATMAGPASSTVYSGSYGVEAAGTMTGAVTAGTQLAFNMDSSVAMTVVYGFVKGGGTAGNVTLSLSASAGTGVLKAGSYVRYTKIA